MRRILATVLPVLLAAAVAVLPAGAAHAANPFDIYALRSPGLHITSVSCQDIAVTAKTTAGGDVANVDAQVQVWLGAAQVDKVDLTPVNGNVQTLAGTYSFCPHRDMPGTYRLGPSDVTWVDQSSNSFSFTDDSTGTMIAKQATMALFGGTRTYAVRTFTARPIFFYDGWNSNSSDPAGWYLLPQGYKVKLQHRAANGTGSWTWVATDRTGPRGRVSFTVRAAHKYQYRVVGAGYDITWRVLSRTLTL